ncbi:MAG: alpha/beta hydrolase [Phocaeicola sp.]
MNRFLYPFLILLTLYPLNGQSQEDLCIGKQYSYHSSILQEDINYQVSLPQNYHAESNQHYPVIYLLDGEAYFEVTNGVIQLYSKGRRAMLSPSILVGITSNNRTRDFTPIASAYDRNGVLQPDARATGGEANLFTSFLTEELIPMIEQNYRTHNQRMLIGHSLAGLYALHLYLNQSILFNRYCILDPSVWWHQGWMVQEAEASIPQDGTSRSSLYLGIAGIDPNKRETIHHSRATTLMQLLEEKVSSKKFHSHIFIEETHGSIFLPGLYEGIKVLYKESL